ncbi:hypothetical protein [Shinella sp.]|uniref:hypothetical protein n=1 Tax=Shinella sp. TaxID=1870904 RepID=UPI00301D131A
MNQRFDELYIRRCEHQQIVAFYKKLVVQMYRKLKTMQAGADGAQPRKADDAATGGAPASHPPAPERKQACNVVRVDFSRGRSGET